MVVRQGGGARQVDFTPVVEQEWRAQRRLQMRISPRLGSHLLGFPPLIDYRDKAANPVPSPVALPLGPSRSRQANQRPTGVFI